MAAGRGAMLREVKHNKGWWSGGGGGGGGRGVGIQITHVRAQNAVAQSSVSADNDLPTGGLRPARSVHCCLYQSLGILILVGCGLSPSCAALLLPSLPLSEPPGATHPSHSASEPLTNECQSGGLWHFYCRHLP